VDDSVVVGDAGHKGKGVFATRAFGAGELIMRSQGRVVHRDDLAALTAWERGHLAELTGETYRVLEPPRAYLNHSCAPNARQAEDAVFAWRAIASGEEITVDYRLNAHDDGGVWRMVCRCEAEPAPHVVVGDFFSLPDGVQARYAPFAPAFIQAEYRRRRELA
jgi:hypothetical protein